MMHLGGGGGAEPQSAGSGVPSAACVQQSRARPGVLAKHNAATSMGLQASSNATVVGPHVSLDASLKTRLFQKKRTNKANLVSSRRQIAYLGSAPAAGANTNFSVDTRGRPQAAPISAQNGAVNNESEFLQSETMQNNQDVAEGDQLRPNRTDPPGGPHELKEEIKREEEIQNPEQLLVRINKHKTPNNSASTSPYKKHVRLQAAHAARHQNILRGRTGQASRVQAATALLHASQRHKVVSSDPSRVHAMHAEAHGAHVLPAREMDELFELFRATCAREDLARIKAGPSETSPHHQRTVVSTMQSAFKRAVEEQ